MNKTIDRVADGVIDTLDKVSSPASRAGSTVERVSKMVSSGVDKEVIALQLSKNSTNNYKYKPEYVLAYCMLLDDTYTKVGITKEQARALISDQKRNTQDTTSAQSHNEPYFAK